MKINSLVYFSYDSSHSNSKTKKWNPKFAQSNCNEVRMCPRVRAKPHNTQYVIQSDQAVRKKNSTMCCCCRKALQLPVNAEIWCSVQYNSTVVYVFSFITVP